MRIASLAEFAVKRVFSGLGRSGRVNGRGNLVLGKLLHGLENATDRDWLVITMGCWG